jgi:RHS repeat-associated protein
MMSQHGGGSDGVARTTARREIATSKVAVLLTVVAAASIMAVAPSASTASSGVLTSRFSTAVAGDEIPQPATYLSIAARTVSSKVGVAQSARSREAVGTAASDPPSPPFTECPAIGADTSCGILIDVTNGGQAVYADSSQGPFDGIEDTLIGVRNDSNSTVTSLQLSANTNLFGFDGDGICGGFYAGAPAGCPFGPTGYEGPGTSFSNINAAETGGDVNFNPGIPPGGTGYFSLEEPLSAATVFSGGPSAAEQGGTPNASELPTTCSSGGPVNCATGTLWHAFTDASISGPGVPLVFTRTYSSAAAGTSGPLGFGWTNSYNMNLSFDASRNATITQENGSTVTFDNSGGAYVTPPRVLATFVANSDGTYTFTRDSNNVQYVFSSSGQLEREIDRNGRITSLTYNGGGQLTTITDQAGRSLSLTYSGGRISQLTDPIGNATTFAYDSDGNLASTTDAGGRTWTFTYDSNHLLLSIVDPRGGKTANTYDASNRVIKQVDPLGRTTTWSYSGDPTSSVGATTTITDPRGVQTSYAYSNLELTSVTRTVGTGAEATTTYTYDPATLGRTSTTDPNGHLTTNTYDGRGDLTSTTDPSGKVTQYTYDGQGDLLTVTDPLGTTTTYTYDTNGNLLSKSTPLSGGGTAAWSYIYGSGATAGQMLSSTNPDGKTTSYTYDSAGDQTSIRDPLGKQTAMTYDNDGRLVTRTTPNGNKTIYVYGADGELVKVIDPLGNVTTYTYDGNRNQTAVTDGNGHTTTFTYNADNEQTQTTLPGGSTNTTTYDGNGNVLTQTDGNGHTTAYTYDPLNRVATTTDPDGRTTTYAYDRAGNLRTTVDASGHATTYSYDEQNRITGISYSGGTTPNVTASYDADGHRISLTDGTGTSTFTYDTLGDLTSETNGAGQTTGYSYDAAGNATSITYPNSHTVTRAYDAAGHLKSVTDWLGNTTTFAYDGDSNVVGETLPPTTGIVGRFQFDNNDRVAAISDTKGTVSLFSATYKRDANGQLTFDDSVHGPDHSYGYTALNQLCYAAPNTQRPCNEPQPPGMKFGYDAGGNLVQNGDTTQVFDPADDLCSTVDRPVNNTSCSVTPRGATSYTYDSRGNRVRVVPATGSPTTLGYDEANRLVAYASATATATYSYDGDSLRMSKTVAGRTIQFAWDESGKQPLLLQAGSSDYVYGPNGEPIEQIDGATPTYLLGDQHHSTRLLANSSGAVAATYTYDPWGKVTSHSGSASTALQYDGQYADTESGYQYLRARYYDPSTGQFLTKDPLASVTHSAYGYVANNPLNGADPTGECLGWIWGASDCQFDPGNVVQQVQNDIPNCTIFDSGCQSYLQQNGKCIVLVQNDCVENWSDNVAALDSSPIGTVLKVDPTLAAIFDYTKWQDGGTITPIDVIADIVGFVPLAPVEDAYLKSILDSGDVLRATREYNLIKGYAGQFTEGLSIEGLQNFLNSQFFGC